MLKNKLKGIPLLLLAVSTTQLKAQKGIVTSDGSASGPGGTVTFSLGQIDYIPLSGPGGSAAPGVQVPVTSATLPITLADIKATRLEDKILVNWSTVTEINSHYFIVQRSNDGVVFTDLKQVSAAGNSSIIKNYLTEDLHPLGGTNYYRIKQIDKDDKFVFSKIVSVTFNHNASIAIVYPNPTTDNVTLKTTNSGSHSLTYKLFNTKGQLLVTNKITDDVTVIKTSHLAPSDYFLKIVDNKKEIKSFKIIKTK